MSATPTQRTCCTCHQPITTISDSYLVTWTLNQSGPPTNIYAHRGQCASIANQTHLTPPPTDPPTQPRQLGLFQSTWLHSGSPNP